MVTVWRQVYNLPLPPPTLPPFSPFLTSLMVSVDVKHYVSFKCIVRAQEPCECRGGRPGLPVPRSLYGLCGGKATMKLNIRRAHELCESRGGRPRLSVPNSPYGFCGRKATLDLILYDKEIRNCVKRSRWLSLIVLMASVDIKQH